MSSAASTRHIASDGALVERLPVPRTARAIIGDTGWQAGFLATLEAIAVLVMMLPMTAVSDSSRFAFAFVLAYGLAAMLTFRRRARLNLSVLDDLPLLLMCVGTASGLAYWMSAMVGQPASAREVALCSLIATGVIGMTRLVSYAAVRSVRASFAGEPAVVIGGGRHAAFLVDRVRTHPEYGLRLLGQYSPDASDPAVPARRQLEDLFQEYPSARSIIVADSEVDDTDLVPGIRAAVARGCRVYYTARFPELRHHRLNAEAIWGLPLRTVHPPAGLLQRGLKRAFDITVSGIALILLAPLMLLVGLLIRRETGGSILFRQRRVGRNAQEFDLLKFQTMVPVDKSEGDTNWNISNDDRLGPFGRFLRATSIDELPQLYNVLRGDMSLVGPRPERPHYVTLFSEEFAHYADRHRVPVGLTGWAQIHRLRGDTSIDDRARFDNAYCDQWSVWSDMKIILKTVPEVLRHSGG